MSEKVFFSESYKRAINNAIGILIATSSEKVRLAQPNAGEYVTYIKPLKESLIFKMFNAKDFSSDEDRPIYLVVEDFMGNKNIK